MTEMEKESDALEERKKDRKGDRKIEGEGQK
jgi:hypothetical protein